MPQHENINVPFPQMRDVGLTEEMLEQIDFDKLLASNPAKLLLENLYPEHSISEIASMLHMSRSTVRKHLKSFGIIQQ